MSWKMSKNLRALMAAATLAVLYIFLLSPLLIVLISSFDPNPQFGLTFPPQGFSLNSYFAIDADLWGSLGYSIKLGLLTSLCSMVLGTMAALGIVRGKLLGQNALVEAIFRAPLQIPHVVVGIAFLQLYYIILDVTGVRLMGTLHGVLIGHVFFATPYVIGTVGAALHRFNPRLEEAALSLGASRISMLRRVTLPIVLPGIYAGGLYAFIVSFGDVPVALFLTGVGQETFPVNIFNSMENDFRPATAAVSSIVMVGSFLLIWIMQKAIGLDNVSKAGK